MLFRSLRWFCRPAVDIHQIKPTGIEMQSTVEIRWYRMNGQYWLEGKNPDHLLFPLAGNMTFRQLLELTATYAPSISLPEGVAEDTVVKEFLLNPVTPSQVNITLNEKPFYIRNMASFRYVQAFQRVNSLPNSLYNLIQKNIKDHGLTAKQASVMTYYQLLFTKEAAKLNQNSTFTEEQRREIMMKVMDSYRMDNPQKLWDLKIEELMLDKVINSLEVKIEEFESKRERNYFRYKLALALISILHILGFGYAIFFVDYLGWDIIEPLTYTVGLFGAILAIFFFIRHRKDRSNESIKATFKRIITKNTHRVWIEDIQNKREFYVEERERVRNKLKIFHMRSDYGYFEDLDVMSNTPPKDELLEEQA